MKIIQLTQGKSTIVSDEDFERVNEFKWCYRKRYGKDAHRQGIAMRSYSLPDGQQGKIYLHRFILNAPEGVLVDHISGDSLDNRRENMRLSTKQGNNHNARKRIDNKSGFRGVSFSKLHKKFRAVIHLNGKQKFLGLFGEADEAAKTYDNAARSAYGEFAALNFPNDGEVGCDR